MPHSGDMTRTTTTETRPALGTLEALAASVKERAEYHLDVADAVAARGCLRAAQEHQDEAVRLRVYAMEILGFRFN